MVVVVGNMNGHVGNSNLEYSGIHGGFGYGCRYANGSRTLQFVDELNVVICNTLFVKQEAKLESYASAL